MRPLRSFLLLFLILICLTGLFYVFPDSGLFPSPNDFIGGIDRFFNSDKELAENGPVAEPSPVLLPDTSAFRDKSDSAVVFKQTSPLAPFLDSLGSATGQVRVMYYGDSQLEGDRVTFYLRQLLREGIGGTGPGLFLPVMPVMYTKSIWIRSSANWKRYNYLSYKSEEIDHTRLGPFIAFCRYLPEGFISDLTEVATVRIQPSGFADTAVSDFGDFRLLYSNPDGPVGFTILNGNKTIYSTQLAPETGIGQLSCPLDGADDIELVFSGKTSPTIYGMSVESSSGVIVDNIPQRGSAGLEFTLTDSANLKASYDILKPDLIILQYGLNIVKNVRNNYSYYEKGLIRQIEALKTASRGIPVMVVGVTDMADNENDTINSYNNIPDIIQSQKKAALATGAYFWDPYSEMGGAGSIIQWSDRKPPLAQKDFVHFTYAGSDSLAGMLYAAIKREITLNTDSINQQASATDSTVTSEVTIGNVTNVTNPERGPVSTVLSIIFGYYPDSPFIFTSPAFWIFLLIALAGFSLVYKRLFMRNFYLLIISLYFYYKSGGLFLFLLILVTVIDFSCGLLIHRSRKKGFKRLFILLSILSNLGILAYFKYTDFFASVLNQLFGTDIKVYDFLAAFSNNLLGTSFDISSIILPVGISFFTFQSLSYTIDIYRGRLKPVRNISDFGFYVSFFPQLVAGPIVRASEFIPQLYSEYHLSDREFSHALFMISKGLIKKIVISDFLALTLIDRVFEAPGLFSGFENLLAVYAYGLQIYCDFSGYTDIAIGVGLLFGFRLPVNFNSPYKARGVADFWKRWHISLSRWLKDYLYISLGGNRKGGFRTGLNLMITMLLGGLWHGASLRYVLWGALHGLGLILDKIWSYFAGERVRSSWLIKVISVFITFNFVNFCWIFFRAPDMDSAILMLRQIWENFNPGSYSTVITAYGTVFLAMLAGYLIHFIPEKTKESYRGVFIAMPLPVRILLMMAVAVFLFQMRNSGITPFIYFRF